MLTCLRAIECTTFEFVGLIFRNLVSFIFSKSIGKKILDNSNDNFFSVVNKFEKERQNGAAKQTETQNVAVEQQPEKNNEVEIVTKQPEVGTTGEEITAEHV